MTCVKHENVNQKILANLFEKFRQFHVFPRNSPKIEFYEIEAEVCKRYGSRYDHDEKMI